MRIAETRLARGSVLLGAAIIAGSGAAYAQAPEVYLGDIYATAEPFCPSTALEPMGQILPISGFEGLFAILGTEYGGDGVRNFRLPDLRNEPPGEGLRYCIVIRGAFPNLFGP